MATFHDRLARASKSNDSILCVGLDPDPALMPVEDLFEFNRAIIDATADLVCCYKPNLAFYEALGIPGLEALMRTIEHVPEGIPVIGDAKRGDIGSTAQAYAKALFQVFGLDAATVNPYLGGDALEPFLEYEDRGIFVLCHTSNPGASDFQELPLGTGNGFRPLYEQVAVKAGEWNRRGNVGLVVGATYPEELQRVRSLCPDMLFLVPGIGAQGGDLEAAVKSGADRRGEGMIINASRSILYASKSREDFASEARRAARETRDQINRAREAIGR